MHCSYHDVLALDPVVYDELVDWLNTEAREAESRRSR